jgi:hypothetical protein
MAGLPSYLLSRTTGCRLSEYRQARVIIARLEALSPDDTTLTDDLAVLE